MEKSQLEQVSSLFEGAFGVEPTSILELGAHASKRQMVRLVHPDGRTYVGVYNENLPENTAFLSFAETFSGLEFPVPQIVSQDLAENAYLQQDLGDQTLWDFLDHVRSTEDPFPEDAEELYKQALAWLVRFQVEGGREIDYSKCEVHQEYSADSMLGDMNYFREEFLARHDVAFDEAKLKESFSSFVDLLLEASIDHFCYRDFQARNIMILESKPYFIDFQGGRKGAVHWDVVSLLYQSSANIPQEKRDGLKEYYISELAKFEDVDTDHFNKVYEGFVLIRMLQVLGAYGKHGLGEGKEYFVNSIPLALKNVAGIIQRDSFPQNCDELKRVLEELIKIYD